MSINCKKIQNYIFISVILIYTGVPGRMSAQENYFATDTSLSLGANVIDGGGLLNARFCRVLKEGEIIKYSPFEVKEYGFKDGKVYVSKEIIINDSSRQVFLERLVVGPTSLYYFKDTNMTSYFLENERTGFIEIPRNAPGNADLTYKDVLKDLTLDCKHVADASKLVKYQKKSLTKYIETYNSCKPKAFPFLKYGVFAGINFSSIVYIPGVGNQYLSAENKYFKNADFKYDPGLIYGIFIDQPIKATDFSFHPEVYFSKNEYTSNYEMDTSTIDVMINTSAINIPVLFRYAVPTAKARPYINAGLIYAYQFKQQSEIYTTPLDGGTIEDENPEMPAPVVTNQLGFAAGTGLEVDLTYRLRLCLDIRYTLLYGLRVSGQESYRKNEFQIVAGISF
jgi:hypothetical protein